MLRVSASCFLRRAGRRAGGQDLQAHGRADLAADDLHHVVETPADHVDRLAALAFADREDAVIGVQRAVHGRGAAGQDVQHGDVVVDELQRGADALVRQAHLNAVLLGIARREVAGVRIEHVRERVHEHFEDVVARDLLGALEHALVALLQDVARLRPGLLGEHQRQRVVLDALAPDLVQLLGRLGPRRLGAVELERLVDGEIRLGLQQLQRVRDALAVAHLEAIEDREHRLELPGDDGVVELVAEALELGDVAGEEVAAPAVELLDEAVQHQRGDRIVDRRLAVVRALDDVADQLADAALALGRREVLRIGGRDRLGDRRLRRTGEQTADHQQCRQAEQAASRGGSGRAGGRVRARGD